MKILEAGHVYDLAQLDTDVEVVSSLDGKPLKQVPAPVVLTFVNREGNAHPGTTTQEVLRALIDRTFHCDNCLPSPYNEKIVYHLRQALLQHELRALERKMDKAEICPETIPLDDDGHFILQFEAAVVGAAKRRF